MKQNKLALFIVAFALVTTLRPDAGWANQPVFRVVGEVTATPTSGEIEVDNHVYKIKQDTAASKAVRSIAVGQKVDLILDAPNGVKNASVVSIAPHSN